MFKQWAKICKFKFSSIFRTCKVHRYISNFVSQMLNFAGQMSLEFHFRNSRESTLKILYTFDLIMGKQKEVQLEVLRLKLLTNTNIYSSILKYGSILIFTLDKRFINLTFRFIKSKILRLRKWKWPVRWLNFSSSWPRSGTLC